jgi:hypothetical protein
VSVFRTSTTSKAYDTAALTEAFRRAVLRLIVRRGLFEQEDAAATLTWPHSGFHVHDAVLVPDGDMAFALRSDKADGPTAGTEVVDPLEFLARLTAHIPNKYQVMTRYYGYYANRVRGARRPWAELIRQIFEVDLLRCHACGAEMRIVAFITQRAAVVRRRWPRDPLNTPAIAY